MYPKTVMAQGIDVMWSHVDDVELLWTYCGATMEPGGSKTSQSPCKNGENAVVEGWSKDPRRMIEG
jgi:hypothetical protein